jgi:hypothetical protein
MTVDNWGTFGTWKESVYLKRLYKHLVFSDSLSFLFYKTDQPPRPILADYDLPKRTLKMAPEATKHNSRM